MPSLTDFVTTALDQRTTLLEALHAEETNCYRLFHGTVEGQPGLSVDRYGQVLLIQTWRSPLDESTYNTLGDFYKNSLDSNLTIVWNHRGKQTQESAGLPEALPDHIADVWGQELGLSYQVNPRHRGKDPLLFLDFRAARRKILANSQGRDVLNLFAYTCGIGCCAAAGSAKGVLNVDFAQSSLEVGAINAQENNFSTPQFTVLKENVFPVIRQFAGLKIGSRGRRQEKFLPLAPRQFDLTILDPPRWATSKFGTVDVVKDYPSLFKPSLMATRKGGNMLVTNNVASVDYSEWSEILVRCARKIGREINEIERIFPETDFPSPDQKPPLKMAWLNV